MALAIDIMGGCDLSKKYIVNSSHRSAILVVHFIVGGAAVIVAKLGQDGALQCTEVSGHIVCIVKH